jgi:FAD/FMN-containing dehydrogenase
MTMINVAPFVSHGISVLLDPVAALRDQVLGDVLTPESDAFDEARRLPYVTVDRRPRVIVRVATAEDIVTTVNFAREQGWPLSVRSGGHSLAYFSVADDAVVVDMSKMKKVTIDPATGIAKVQGGATSGDLAAAAQPLGLALTTGDTRSVGIGGLTTGGGVGFMVRKYGLTIDNLLSAKVVLADGRIVTASVDEHADLFWAIRGGGGNVGIITEFTFQLARVGTILGGDLMLPASREVVRKYLDYVATAPEDLTTIANVMQAPPAPYVPAERIGEVVLSILVSWTGSIEEGKKVLAPLRALAEPVADTVAPIPYEDIYRYTDHYSAPHSAAIRMMFSDALSDDAIDAGIEAIRNASSPFGMFHLRGLGGAMSRVAADATAFANRTQQYFVAIINVWLDPADDAAVHQAWTESLWQKIRHEGSGVYVNFLESEGEERIREAYPAGAYERLAEVKGKYDPENFFRFNQNVSPKH